MGCCATQHISRLAVRQINCLRCICGIFKETQVARSFLRVPDGRLPKKLFSGEVKGARPPSHPRSNFNDVVSCDFQKV